MAALTATRTRLLAGIAVVAVIAVVGLCLVWAGSKRTQPLSPQTMMGYLPGTSAAALGVNTDPGLPQKLSIGRLLAASSDSGALFNTFAHATGNPESVKKSTFAYLASGVFPGLPASAVPDWIGPVFAASVSAPSAGSPGMTAAVSFTSSNASDASAWLDDARRLSGGSMSWNSYPDQQNTVFVVANSVDPAVTTGARIIDEPARLAGLDDDAPATVYANLEQAAKITSTLEQAPVFSTLSMFGLLGSGSKGVVTGTVNAVNDTWVVSGQGSNVAVSGAKIAAGNADLSVVKNAPASSSVTVAVAKADEQLAVVTGQEGDRVRNIAQSLSLQWPAATRSVFGERTVVAVGPEDAAGANGGWRSYDAGAGAGAAASKLVAGYLTPNSGRSWAAVPTATGAAIATTASWANALANPKQGQTLGDAAAFEGLVDGADSATYVAVVDGKALSATSDALWWRTVSAAGLVVHSVNEQRSDITFDLTVRPG